MKISKVALAISTVIFVSACGSDNNSNINSETKAPVESSSVNVKVIEAAALEGATVWLDKKENQNFTPDKDEPQAVSTSNGEVTFDNVKVEDLGNYVLVAQVNVGETINHHTGKTVASSYLLTAPLPASGAEVSKKSSETSSFVISPLSSLVEMKLRQPEATSSQITLASAASKVASEFAISDSNIITSDYTQLVSDDATKAKQAAISLVASDVMAKNAEHLDKNDDAVLIAASEVSKILGKAEANQLVIQDEKGQLLVVADDDTDEDGIIDALDAFPESDKEWYDIDEDGIGDNSDAFPLDPKESVDTDKDKIGNNADQDDDNDGYLDSYDNNPLEALVVPKTLNACLESLPDYPDSGQSAKERPHSRLYEISRVMSNNTESKFKQSEIFVEQRKGLHNGLLPDSDVNVTQISSESGDNSLGVWNPGFEFNYEDAKTGKYIGNQDIFSRWWSVTLKTNFQDDLELNQPTAFWVDRLDQFSPREPVRHEGLSSTYLGKDIIETAIGLREVCVVQESSELALGTVNDPQAESSSGALVVEEFKKYFDHGKVIQLVEGSSLQYDSVTKENLTWGYTDLSKKLVGLVEDQMLYGLDPVKDRVPEDQPLTMKQCLSELPDAGYKPVMNDSVEYLMDRTKLVKNENDEIVLVNGIAEVEKEQKAIYTMYLLSGENVNWRGKEGLTESTLHGAFVNDYFEPEQPYYEFTERYFIDAEGRHTGFEATHMGSNQIAWGNEALSNSQISIDGSYFQPEVISVNGRLLVPNSGKENFKEIRHTVFAGKEMVWNSSLLAEVPACKQYSRSEVTFYTEDGQPLLDNDGKVVKEFIDEMIFSDNKGAIARYRQTQSWDTETWSRSELNVSNQ